MDIPVLAATSRAVVGKKVEQLRRQRQIPGVMYGHGLPSVSLGIDSLAFQKVWRQAGSSSLVDLTVDQKPPVKVLIHDTQHHPTTSAVLHVDFYRVKMSEKLQTDIELNFVGQSPAVKEQGGIFVRSLDKVKVECLPADLVHAIDVDISSLKKFEDRLHVRDIIVPQGVTILGKPDEVVASVMPPRSESELEALSSKVEEDVTAVAGVEPPVEPVVGEGEEAGAVATEPDQKTEPKPDKKNQKEEKKQKK